MRKVNFKGKNLWAMSDIFGMGFPLAPPNHVDDEGELKPDAVLEVSFAHVFPDGDIKQFGKVIGKVTDLKEGWV